MSSVDDKELISLLFDPASPLRTSDSSGESEAIPLPYMSGLHFI
ncbi:hypothetical protein [Paenibacillus odorifer]|nr:hypothetical protein [Paenibacillus odorifer]MEC0134821.1 hypothetical protein [Paenibacillus odorifer]